MTQSVLLSELVTQHQGLVALVPFAAQNGCPVMVTAVLERTAVVHEPGSFHDKRLCRLDSLTVDPQLLQWHKPKPNKHGSNAFRQDSGERGRELSRRSASDRRARLKLEAAI